MTDLSPRKYDYPYEKDKYAQMSLMMLVYYIVVRSQFRFMSKIKVGRQVHTWKRYIQTAVFAGFSHVLATRNAACVSCRTHARLGFISGCPHLLSASLLLPLKHILLVVLG